MTAEVYAFGDCVLDVGQARLTRSGRVVPMEPRCFNVLTHLVRRSGELVSKSELADAVWSDMAVTDGNLHTAVKAARRAVGQEFGGTYPIECVTKRGFRFHDAKRVQGTPGPDQSTREVWRRYVIAALQGPMAQYSAQMADRALKAEQERYGS